MTRSLLLSTMGLSAVGFALIQLLTPATELTRFRNSLIAHAGEVSDFEWSPAQVPQAYLYETQQAPDILLDAVHKLRPSDDKTLSVTIELVRHLRGLPKKRGPIMSTTVRAYQEIVETGRGYCADYTQVFNGLAYSAGLNAREWGMSFDRYSGDGHAFNEVYDIESHHWVFIDPMNGFFVRDREMGTALSAMEFRSRLIMDGGFDSVDIVPIGEGFLFESARDAFEYYQRGADQFFLWFGNNVLSYDAHPVTRTIGPWSRSLEQLAAILIGIHPEIRLLRTETNPDDIDDLFRLRFQVMALTALGTILALIVCVQLVRSWRVGRLAARQ